MKPAVTVQQKPAGPGDPFRVDPIKGNLIRGRRAQKRALAHGYCRRGDNPCGVRRAGVPGGKGGIYVTIKPPLAGGG